MNNYIFITNEGSTFQPYSNSLEPDIENCQVIGFSSEKNENEAFNNLLEENEFIKETSFDQIISYQLTSDSDRSKKYFYLSEKN
jgi:hypothetical protein